MKKYPKMKPSGVDWIGEVPEHWEVVKLKRFLTVKSGDFHSLENDAEEDGYPIYGGNGFRGYSKEFNLDGETLLIGRVGAKCGNIHLVKGKFWISEHALRVISKKEFDNRFFKYLLEVVDFNQFAIRTAQPLINTTIVEEQIVTVSESIPEQTAIAAYLDRKTAQIDQAIAEKERLIELFREERQAIINHAVTKGIRSGVKMKPSGVEWIGDVPEGWEVKKLKYFCKVISKGTTPSTEGQDFTQKGVRFLKAENIAEGSILPFPEFFINEETNEILQRSQLQENDLLIVIAGATIGKIGIVTKGILPANTNQAVCFLRLHEKELVGFLHLVLQADYIQRVVKFDAVQSAQPNLAMGVLGNFRIAAPPNTEIIDIVDFIGNKTAQIDTAISGIRQEIALLQEYRQALIFEAVTGKIDVREHAQN